jgi:hypothetical protein
MGDLRDHDRVDGGDHSDHTISVQGAAPGTPAFGAQAAARKAMIAARQQAGDNRIQAAGRVLQKHKLAVNRILAGD